ncbi:MAG: helix-turn-helix transcriptional regulator [Eubacteriales bacterium]|nr:helix-turn-helix transcriptional regulator [Eubacteriales bacterium]
MAELKELRKIMGITQKELADRAGINVRHIQRLENGESDIDKITTENRENLEKILGITLEEMKKLNLGIFTEDAKASVKSGDLTIRDLLDMDKMNKVKKLSKIGALHGMFSANYDRIPEGIFDKLTAEELAGLVDAIYDAYSAGKAEREAD